MSSPDAKPKMEVKKRLSIIDHLKALSAPKTAVQRVLQGKNVDSSNVSIRSGIPNKAGDDENFGAASIPEVGLRVVTKAENEFLVGSVRYVGKTVFSAGDWIGIELDGPWGKNSGSALGVQYFSCSPLHGLFVQPRSIEAQGQKAVEQFLLQNSHKPFVRSRSPTVRLFDEVPGQDLPQWSRGLEVGNRVQIMIDGKRVGGQVQFVGETKFAKGIWVGIALESRMGKNNGTVGGHNYFTAMPGRGIFVRPEVVMIKPDKSQKIQECDEESQSKDGQIDLEILTGDELRVKVVNMQEEISNLQQKVSELEHKNAALESRNAELELEIVLGTERNQAKNAKYPGRRMSGKSMTRQSWAEAPSDVLEQEELEEEEEDVDSSLDCDAPQQPSTNSQDVQDMEKVRDTTEIDSDLANNDINNRPGKSAKGMLQGNSKKTSPTFSDKKSKNGLRGKKYRSEDPVNVDNFQEGDTGDSQTLVQDVQTGLEASSSSKLAQNAEIDQHCVDDMSSDMPSKPIGSAVLTDESAVFSSEADRSSVLFKVLDVNKQGKLKCPEMYRFAKLMGFPGSMEDFDEDYKGLCQAMEQDALFGLDASCFLMVIDDIEGDYYCDDKTLSEILSSVVDMTAPTDASAQLSSEPDCLSEVFSALDVNQQGRLKAPEMLRFVKFWGVRDSTENFEDEYKELCERMGQEAQTGLDVSSFATLVNEGPYYCDDDHLKDMLSRLVHANAADQRALQADPVRQLFKLLDTEKQGRLMAPEMLSFAQLMGFPGGMDDFQEEYIGMCEAMGQEAQYGLDASSFASMVSDVQGDYYCEDRKLNDMLSSLGSTTAPANALAQLPLQEYLVTQLFEALDVRKQGRLKGPEMLRFAQIMGFPGGMDDFQEEYIGMCEALEQEAQYGLDAPSFSSMVKDVDGDYYCDNNALSEMLSNLGSTTAPANASGQLPPGVELVSQLFKALDTRKQGRIRAPEMLRFAQLMGFPGGMDDFQEEYTGICEATGQEAQHGLDASSFASIVNDVQGDYYCDDTTLTEMLSNLGSTTALASAQFHADSVSQLFTALDASNQGRLKGPEMLRFAQLMGFPGSMDDFQEEYIAACEALGQDAHFGVDASSFASMVNDVDGDYYCDCDTLSEMLSKLSSATTPANASAQLLLPAVSVGRLFEALDANEQGRLKGKEMFRFAQLMGFPGGMDDFQEEYIGMCEALGQDAQSGLDASCFETLVNDTDGDYYCDDNTLSAFLSQLGIATHAETSALPLPHTDLSSALFKALDVNKQGKLKGPEMFCFAQLLGFPGDADEFQKEYIDLCQVMGRDAQNGLDASSFVKLVNDVDGDYYCDDSKLGEILSGFE